MSTLTIRDHLQKVFSARPVNTAAAAGWGGDADTTSGMVGESGILRGLGDIELTFSNVFVGILSVILAYALSRIIYNLYFHPLSSFPGPKLAAISYTYRSYMFFSGEYHLHSYRLHQKYGPFVRTAPNELSMSSVTGFRALHSYHRGGDPAHHGQHFRKGRRYFLSVDGKQIPANILTARDPEVHHQKRRRIASAFSTKALAEQEELITKWIDLLVTQIEKYGEGGKKPLDVVKWYNMTTFDIIGDLSFGEDFGSLKGGDTHFWVSLIFKNIQLGGFLGDLLSYPWIDKCLKTVAKGLMPKELVAARVKHLGYSRDKVTKRLNMKTDRKDFMSYILGQGETLPDVQEMTMECSLLIVAGSETTATFLVGATYLLLSNPTTYTKLVSEIRSVFPSYSSINYETTSHNLHNLPYLVGVIEEGLRMFPPAPGAFPREAPAEGAYLDDVYIPPGVEVYGCSRSLTRSPEYWHKPDSFIPERWLDPTPPEHKNDVREASNPFSLGPRGCIGKNLAYMEMRLILCKVLYKYDLELDPGSEGWMEKQKMYALWEKKPMFVKFKERSDVKC